MKKMLKLVSAICLFAVLLTTFIMVVGAADDGSSDATTVSTADAATIAQNSKYLFMYLDYLADFTDETAWEADFATLDRIVTKARALVKEGNYDPTYKNLSAMVTAFAPMDAYFYAKLQASHIAYINALNAAFDSSEMYIEKLGICAEIKKYAESVDIDPANADLAALIAANEQRLASMDDLKDAYVEILYDNADAFVAVVSGLNENKTYNEVIAIIEDASEYYYSMVIADTETLTEAEIAAAVDKYNEYIVYAEETLKKSEDFKVVVNAIASAVSYSERYQLISEAYDLVDFVSTDVTGVSAAISVYDDAYEDYMSLVNGAKTEMVATQASVVTLRSKWGCANILNFFAELVGFTLD